MKSSNIISIIQRHIGQAMADKGGVNIGALRKAVRADVTDEAASGNTLRKLCEAELSRAMRGQVKGYTVAATSSRVQFKPNSNGNAQAAHVISHRFSRDMTVSEAVTEAIAKCREAVSKGKEVPGAAREVILRAVNFPASIGGFPLGTSDAVRKSATEFAVSLMVTDAKAVTEASNKTEAVKSGAVERKDAKAGKVPVAVKSSGVTRPAMTAASVAGPVPVAA